MTGAPPLTTAEPSAASKSICAPENASSGQPQPSDSAGNDEEVVRTDSENANGVVNLNYSAEISGRKSSWRQSKSFQIIRPRNMGLEDTDSPRFQEILRVTNGHTKKTPYTKSCSLDPSYKAVNAQLEDVKLMIREKFNQAKEEVNAELVVFAGELMAALRQTPEFHPEWKKDLEDLLLVAHKSAQMSAEEFWSKCEGIVLNLDHHRHELPLGMVKQAHTRLLFILTRCTRLVQCQ